MIADAIGVTKAALYLQYSTKEEIIILAVGQVVLGRLEGGRGRGSGAIPLASARGVDRRRSTSPSSAAA
jgi:AcrR family transcriptional regulator